MSSKIEQFLIVESCIYVITMSHIKLLNITINHKFLFKIKTELNMLYVTT